MWRECIRPDRPLRIVHYLNQFFGQVGGEAKADAELQVKNGPVGPGLAFQGLFGDKAKIVASVICGDNTMSEDLERISADAAERAAEFAPDIFIAGRAFSPAATA